MGDIYLESSENITKNIHIYASNLYDCYMNQLLPYKVFRLTNDVNLNEVPEADIVQKLVTF